jgi:hypothetical protein
MVRELEMGRYQKGEHVKIEVIEDRSGVSEWVWLLVQHSDDEQRLVFGELDSEPVVAKGPVIRRQLGECKIRGVSFTCEAVSML